MYSLIWPFTSSPTMVSPEMEISSRPSRPYTTITCFDPSRCSTRTWMPTRSGWNTPSTWFFAPAGLVSGPRMLKIVRTPRSLRTGAAYFVAAWCAGANMKPSPSFSIACPVSAGVTPMWAPRASRTSALPDEEDTERPMCLATFAPAAAATNAAQVETLNVWAASPPVPQVSTRWRSSFTSTGVASSRMTWAAAAISPMVSFFTRRPTTNPAICAGLSSPRMICRMTCSISSWNTSRCSTVRWIASAMVICFMVFPLPLRVCIDEILQHSVAMLGEQRLRVELHPFDRQAAVAQAHDLAVLGFSAHHKTIRQRIALHHQRVVARRHKTIRYFPEYPVLVVTDARGLAVHHLPRAHHFPAESLPDRLVSQADAEDRHPAGEAGDELEAHPGLVRRAWTGGDDDVRRLYCLYLLNRNFIISENRDLGAELAQVLHQVVGERIVVVEHHDHRTSFAPPGAQSAAALRSASALCCVSCHSERGSESATMPAAACTCSRPSLTTAVRIAMARSMSPLNPR